MKSNRDTAKYFALFALLASVLVSFVASEALSFPRPPSNNFLAILLIPVFLATLGTLFVWTGPLNLVAAFATMLSVFAVLTGFSIGMFYVPSAGALFISWVIARTDLVKNG